VFSTTADGASNPTERARIDSIGRLLVGAPSTSTLGATTQIVGLQTLSLHNGANTSGGSVLTLSKSRNTTYNSYTIVQSGDTLGIIAFRGDDGTDYITSAASISAEVDGTPGANDMPGRLVFSTTADGANIPTERMRIGQNGQFTFQAPANPTFVFTDTNPSNTGGRTALEITTGTFSTSDTTSLYCNFLRGDGTQRGRIRSNGATAVAYETTSDYRLKENVVTLSNGIDRLQQLKPYRFNFIDDGPGRVVDGFIAHEVQEVVHEAVGGTKDAVDADGNPVYQGIDQSKLVPLLTAALQEALSEIESLKARVTALEP
jgi:hypothetical protein